MTASTHSKRSSGRTAIKASPGSASGSISPSAALASKEIRGNSSYPKPPSAITVPDASTTATRLFSRTSCATAILSITSICTVPGHDFSTSACSTQGSASRSALIGPISMSLRGVPFSSPTLCSTSASRDGPRPVISTWSRSSSGELNAAQPQKINPRIAKPARMKRSRRRPSARRTVPRRTRSRGSILVAVVIGFPRGCQYCHRSSHQNPTTEFRTRVRCRAPQTRVAEPLSSTTKCLRHVRFHRLG